MGTGNQDDWLMQHGDVGPERAVHTAEIFLFIFSAIQQSLTYHALLFFFFFSPTARDSYSQTEVPAFSVSHNA